MTLGENKNLSLLLLFALLFIFLVASSGCLGLTYAYVPDPVVLDGWYENTSLRNTGLQFLGLEKWCSLVYEIDSLCPASLTVTTLKTLVLPDEEKIYGEIIRMIEETFKGKMELHNSTIRGMRRVLKNHETLYVIYNGSDTCKVIGEVWNCGTSGTSIVCIGVAYVTCDEKPVFEKNWRKIVMDPTGTIDGLVGESGLIYNVRCH
jgi:predicted small secreted protein